MPEALEAQGEGCVHPDGDRSRGRRSCQLGPDIGPGPAADAKANRPHGQNDRH